MFMLVGPSDDIIKSKIVTGPNLKIQSWAEPPEPNASYAPAQQNYARMCLRLGRAHSRAVHDRDLRAAKL